MTSETNVCLPTLNIPIEYPPTGSFDGCIFATVLPRETALDRMLQTLDLESRLERFKEIEMILFEDFMKPKPQKAVFDDIVQRIAFAVAMKVPEFQTLDDLKKLQIQWQEKTQKLNIQFNWVPASAMLRPIYFAQQWGWDSSFLNNNELWALEINRAKKLGENPRAEMFPSKKRELEVMSFVQNFGRATGNQEQEKTA
jgi:hypothetical protein